jgi:hypothetical protein
MPSPLPFRPKSSQPLTKESRARKLKELESIAQLIEDMIPKFKKEEERQFYLEVAQSYRTVVRDALKKNWWGNQG